MYIPKMFDQSDREALSGLITEYPFATLISTNESGIEANHLPLYLSENGSVLKGHIAKANPLWKDVADGASVLVIFQGPHHYITPNYYPTKKEHGRVVPTYNYASVHVKGLLSFIHDGAWKLDMLNELTNKFESSQAMPWQVADAPPEFIEKQLVGIVGIEVAVQSMQGKWKLSQNQPAHNQNGVIEGLTESATTNGAGVLAEFMDRQR